MPKGVYHHRTAVDYADVHRLRADGLTTRQIAERLHISMDTVHRAEQPHRRAYEIEHHRLRRLEARS